jgi:hypothetical protein
VSALAKQVDSGHPDGYLMRALCAQLLRISADKFGQDANWLGNLEP